MDQHYVSSEDASMTKKWIEEEARDQVQRRSKHIKSVEVKTSTESRAAIDLEAIKFERIAEMKKEEIFSEAGMKSEEEQIFQEKSVKGNE
eukprot:1106348-Karenia_brevis.AAC.1